MRWRSASLIWTILAVAAPVCFGQHPIPEAERWATITHPGNESYTLVRPGLPPKQVGRVDYEFQISRTEVTGAEWFEFVQAYAPYVDAAHAFGTAFTSRWIVPHSVPGGGFAYDLNPVGANRAITSNWHFAARYVNWLHNGKALTQDAFERGVYDTSTFGTAPDGSLTDQMSHSAHAKYWIPTEDEWIKSVYFDPNRYGIAQSGYWPYPYASELPPVTGVPGEGETSAGQLWGPYGPFDVGAYRDSQTPWGLWDASGGEDEWLESPGISFAGQFLYRVRAGTSASPIDPKYWDSINEVTHFGLRPQFSSGLRLARQIPSPNWLAVSCMSLFVFHGRRR